MKKPNFFIIGAPKCGTTSLANWLSSHPHIYVSPNKEPNHFNTDLNTVPFRRLSEYEKLFSDATSEHIAVGEATTLYLYSKDAVRNIKEYNKDSKFIVCARNPIMMAYSLHEQHYTDGHEHVANFTDAWNLQSARQNGEFIVKRCSEPKVLQYREICSLGAQLERLYNEASCDRVHLVLLDDIIKDPRSAYLRILDFLDVKDDGRTDFPVINSAKTWNSRRAAYLANVLRFIKRFTGLQYRTFGVLRLLKKGRLVNRERPPMSLETREILQSCFESDINKLSVLIGRDLSHWN